MKPAMLAVMVFGLAFAGGAECLPQPISYGHTYPGSVTTPTSCQFAGGGWPYAPFTVSLAQGDEITLTVHSDVFDPRVGVYRYGGSPLAFNQGKQGTQDAVLRFTAGETVTYLITVSGPKANPLGNFSITSSLIRPCTPLRISSQPVTQIVAFGDSAVLSVAVTSNSSEITFTWYDAGAIGLPIALGSGPSFTVTNVRATRRLYVQAVGGCGVVTSAVVTVIPFALRERSARH
jgi:hypothetical protein